MAPIEEVRVWFICEPKILQEKKESSSREAVLIRWLCRLSSKPKHIIFAITRGPMEWEKRHGNKEAKGLEESQVSSQKEKRGENQALRKHWGVVRKANPTRVWERGANPIID